MAEVHIVLVEWMGYPLFRRKRIGSRYIKCGLGRLLANMQRYDAGVSFDCSVVLNECDIRINERLVFLAKQPVFGRLLRNRVSTNVPSKYERLIADHSVVNQAFYRENDRQDLGAYNFLYEYLRDQCYEGHVLFMNSSVRGPHEDGWLKKYQHLFTQDPNTGICGISMNSHYTGEQKRFAPHVQSFCLYTSMAVLTQVFPGGLLDPADNLTKDQLIQEGEIGISTRVLDAGLGLRCSSFPEFYYENGRNWTIPEGDLRFDANYEKIANQL